MALKARLRTDDELHQLRREDVWYNLFGCAFIGLIAALIIFGISAGFTALGNSNVNNRLEIREKIVATVNAHLEPDGRRDVAQSLLDLSSNGLIPGSKGTDNRLDETVSQSLQTVAVTGQPLSLDMTPAEWNSWQNFVMWLGGVYLGLLLISLFAFYGFVTADLEPLVSYRYAGRNPRYLADLPWKQVWPIALVAVTPFAWPFYIVSAIRIYRAKARGETREQTRLYTEYRILGHRWETFQEFQERRQQEREQERRAEADLWHRDPGLLRYDGFRGAMDDLLEYRHGIRVIAEDAPKPKKAKFTAAPKAAKALYVAMRTVTWQSGFKDRLNRLRNEVTELTDNIRELGTSIQAKQRALNTTKATIREMEEAEKDQAPAPGLEHLDAEFERLQALPGVAGVRVVNDKISVLLKARLEYEGTRYDLGDWDIRFGADGNYSVKRLRSGVRSDWTGGYPVYGSEDSFCFNARDTAIRMNFAKGQFLEAMEIVVNSMQSVNDDHMTRIPKAYRKDKAA